MLSSAAALAETLYVHDKLYVPLRTGISNQHQILHKGIRSGTALELLEADPESGYSRVRLPDGLEGWIQTQYLTDSPIAADLLDQATSRLRNQQAENKANIDQLVALRRQLSVLSDDRQTLSQLNQALTEELQKIKELAANVIIIQSQNEALQTERKSLNAQVGELQVAVDAISSNNDRDWFVRGAGTVLLSLLAGFIIARRFYHRRANDEWT